MKLTVVTGLSGSGKIIALRALEDADYYCIDNLPLALLKPVTEELLLHSEQHSGNLAVGIDARTATSDLSALPVLVKELRAEGIDCRILYLDSSDSVLLQRFSETRRRHPLTGNNRGLTEAIAAERVMLQPLRDSADHLIDTSKRSIHELRHQVRAQIADAPNQMQVLLKSFGFKHGIPEDADLVFDARALPNPYWQQELRHLNGTDEAIQQFLSADDQSAELISQIASMATIWLPRFNDGGRNYFTICVGCTGGQHRSVYVIEQLAKQLQNTIPASLLINHRELE